MSLCPDTNKDANAKDDRDTKQRILDAAETLFAHQGFAHTSMRAITAFAGVNLAAINYHFGSKDSLVEAVFARRLMPMNQMRLAELAALEQRYDKQIPLPELIRAFIVPALTLSRDKQQGGALFIKLLGQSYTDASETLQRSVRNLHKPLIDRFKQSFSLTLPQLPRSDLYWRMHFMVGLLAYCMAGSDMMRLIASCQVCDPDDSESLIQRLVAFLQAGLLAPLTNTELPLRAGEQASA